MTAPPDDPRAALPPAAKSLGWWEGDRAAGTPYVSDGHLLLWAPACTDPGLLARLRGRRVDHGVHTSDWARVLAPFAGARADTVRLAALYDRDEGTRRPRLTARFLDADGEVAADVDARGLALALGALGGVERVTADFGLAGSFVGLWREGLVVGALAGLRIEREPVAPTKVRAGALPTPEAGPSPWPGPHLWPFDPYPAALDAVTRLGEDTEATRAAGAALRDTLAATVAALGGAGDTLPTRAGWASRYRRAGCVVRGTTSPGHASRRSRRTAGDAGRRCRWWRGTHARAGLG